jgi:cytidylate kinase
MNRVWRVIKLAGLQRKNADAIFQQIMRLLFFEVEVQIPENRSALRAYLKATQSMRVRRFSTRTAINY